MNIEFILNKEGVLLNKECVVCFNKFINIKDKNYSTFLAKIKEKYKLSKNNNNFEDETICLCYDARFECLICKNIVCCTCIMNMPDYENGKQLNKYAMFLNDYTKEVFETLCMDETGIVSCPICRTKDYRLFYTGKERGVLPEEILYEIKNHIK
jgi:hypothetical protein